MPDPVFLSGADVPDYLLGVELMSAGMEWHASTGDVTITMEHLADAVRAAGDPHIQAPRIKLGHGSPVNGSHEDHDPFAALGDAEPCFGQFTNLRLANDGAVLLGDATNVPEWLAAIAPAAYPNRSAECVWQVDTPSLDVQTNGGRRYSMVVTAVSLLGVYAPAISDLEDLTALIMNGPAAATAAAPTSAAATTDPAALSVSTSVIRERFNFDWAMDSDNGVEQNTYWWWARDVRVDDDEVIADDDEGGLWSVPYSTDGEDTVTFGEPVRVRETFVPVAAKQVASFSRPSKPSRPHVAASNPAATGRPDEGESPMTDQVREFLVGRGIDPDTATEVQINAATILMAEQSPAEPEAPETPQAETDETPEAEAEVETQTPERVPVAASAPDPIALAQKQAFDSLAAEVASLRAERDQANLSATAKRRDEKVGTALTAGRITLAEREHYRSLLDVDEERAGALLEALPSGRVPLEARAEAPDPEAAGLPPVGEPLPSNVSLLNPSERAALAARRAV